MFRVSSAKKDIRYADIHAFDVLSFTDTWLSSTITDSDIVFPSFHTPFRRDRPNDPHGGIVVYVKSNIYVAERSDIEVLDIECLWLELRLKNKRILLGTL